MSDLLLNIYCPSMSKSYDFWIPAGITVKSAIGLLCDDISVFENNPQLFADRDALILCSYLNQRTLSQDMTMEQAGVQSGDRLTLV